MGGCSTGKNPFVQNRAAAYRFPQEQRRPLRGRPLPLDNAPPGRHGSGEGALAGSGMPMAARRPQTE